MGSPVGDRFKGTGTDGFATVSTVGLTGDSGPALEITNGGPTGAGVNFAIFTVRDDGDIAK